MKIVATRLDLKWLTHTAKKTSAISKHHTSSRCYGRTQVRHRVTSKGAASKNSSTKIWTQGISTQHRPMFRRLRKRRTQASYLVREPPLRREVVTRNCLRDPNRSLRVVQMVITMLSWAKEFRIEINYQVTRTCTMDSHHESTTTMCSTLRHVYVTC